MLVGLENNLLGYLVMPKHCLDIPKLKFQLTITVNYVDVASGSDYFQFFIESLEVDMEQLKASAKSKYNVDLTQW